MAEPTPFEQALEAAAATSVAPETAEPDLVAAALDAHRERLAGARSLGDPGIDTDLYAVADRVAEAMRACYPGIRCGRGCSGCCETPTAVFDVTATEWDAIRRHLASQWPSRRRAALIERFQAHHAARLWAYRALAAVLHFEPWADRYFQRRGYVCPFIEEGACGIYPVRPLACRMYGHHATGGGLHKRAAVYGCRIQADYFESVLAVGPLRLPSAEALWAKARRLTREFPWRWRRRARILPLWIATWLAEEYDGTAPPSPVEPP